MAKMKGHKRRCRCVGCSPKTRRRGLRASRKRRKNPKTRAKRPRATVLAEVESIANELARKGLSGARLDPLPRLTSADAADWIASHQAEFRRMVRRHRELGERGSVRGRGRSNPAGKAVTCQRCGYVKWFGPNRPGPCVCKPRLNPRRNPDPRRELEREFGPLDKHGRIKGPGKFEGEPLYVPYFWGLVLEGASAETVYDGDTPIDIFNVEAEDRRTFPELEDAKTIALWESEQGFVYHRLDPPEDLLEELRQGGGEDE